MGIDNCPSSVDIFPSTGLIPRRAKANDVDNHNPLRLDDWSAKGSGNNSLSRFDRPWISKGASACAIVAPTGPPISNARRTIPRQPNRRRRVQEAIGMTPTSPDLTHNISDEGRVTFDAPRPHLAPGHEGLEHTLRRRRGNFDLWNQN